MADEAAEGLGGERAAGAGHACHGAQRSRSLHACEERWCTGELGECFGLILRDVELGEHTAGVVDGDESRPLGKGEGLGRRAATNLDGFDDAATGGVGRDEEREDELEGGVVAIDGLSLFDGGGQRRGGVVP